MGGNQSFMMAQPLGLCETRQLHFPQIEAMDLNLVPIRIAVSSAATDVNRTEN